MASSKKGSLLPRLLDVKLASSKRRSGVASNGAPRPGVWTRFGLEATSTLGAALGAPTWQSIRLAYPTRRATRSHPRSRRLAPPEATRDGFRMHRCCSMLLQSLRQCRKDNSTAVSPRCTTPASLDGSSPSPPRSCRPSPVDHVRRAPSPRLTLLPSTCRRTRKNWAARCSFHVASRRTHQPSLPSVRV